jgi:hypothetical protein
MLIFTNTNRSIIFMVTIDALISPQMVLSDPSLIVLEILMDIGD